MYVFNKFVFCIILTIISTFTLTFYLKLSHNYCNALSQ